MEWKEIMNRYGLKQKILSIAPIFGLLALVVCFFAGAKIKDLNIAYSMKNILNQSVVVAVIATGAIFIYTLGSFDISLGASACVSALVGGMAYNATGSVPLIREEQTLTLGLLKNMFYLGADPAAVERTIGKIRKVVA